MATTTKKKEEAREALAILDGMMEIAENEQLQQGTYVSDYADPELAAQGAICGGHKACLLGGMWISAGVPITMIANNTAWLSNVTGNRKAMLSQKPALKIAYTTLNRLAYQDMVSEGHTVHPMYKSFSGNNSAAEEFFETFLHEDDYETIRDEVIALCERGKTDIRKQYGVR